MERKKPHGLLEKKIFTRAFKTGIVDLMISGILLQLAFSILVSRLWGDEFRTQIALSGISLGFIAVALLIQKHLVVPRIGYMRFKKNRKSRTVILLVIDAAMLAVGILIQIKAIEILPNDNRLPDAVPAGLIFLTVFLGMALVSGLNRMYIYGLFGASSFIMGRWLDIQTGSLFALPITLMFVSGIIMLQAFVTLAGLMKKYPLRREAEK